MKKDTWKNADYPNAVPSWRKGRTRIKYVEKKTQLERVLASLDYNKLANIGKDINGK